MHQHIVVSIARAFARSLGELPRRNADVQGQAAVHHRGPLARGSTENRARQYAPRMRLQDIIAALDDIAPLRLAESWDKVGLHVGDPSQRIKRILLCIDLTEAVVEEALDVGANLIVAYHPPIFRPLDRLVGRTWKERALLTAVRKHVAVYSPHTALDATADGLGDWLCAGVGAGTSRAITDRALKRHSARVTVHVEASDDAAVRDILLEAQAGRPVLTSEAEASTLLDGQAVVTSRELTRVEAIVSADAVAGVRRRLAALQAQGDIVSLEFTPHPQAGEDRGPAQGSGRIHTLHDPISPTTLVRRLKQHLRLKHLELAAPRADAIAPRGPTPGKIQRIAVCPGAGGGLFEKLRPGLVDAYFTGEMRHHDVLAAVQRGQVVLLAGHTQTERPYLRSYRGRILKGLRARVRAQASGRKKPRLTVDIRLSKADRAPSRVV